MTERTRVFVYRNEAGAEGKLMTFESKNLEALKSQASQKLGIRATRVFLATGAEIKTTEELQDGDNLYFSAGEPFYRKSGSIKNEKINIAVLGAGAVGKSAIIWRFLRNTFVHQYDPTIQDVFMKTVRIDDELNVLEILDTAGQEDFVSMRSQWMIDMDAYVFVYSLVDKASVRNLYGFIDLLTQVCDGFDKAPPAVFIGNKKDIIDKSPDLRVSTLEEIRYVIEAYEEASRALDRKSSMRTSTLSQALLHGSQGSRNQSLSDSMQSSGVYNHNDSTLESPSPSRPIGLSGWMEDFHFVTSALTGEKVADAFTYLVREVRKRRKIKEAQIEDKFKKSFWDTWCSVL